MNQNQNGQYSPAEFNPSDYISILRRNKWIVIGIALIIVLATGYYSYTTQPIYRASTTIMYPGPGDQQTQQIFNNNSRNISSTSSELFLSREIEYLHSRNLAIHVIDSLKNTPYVQSMYLFGTAGEVKQSPLSKLMQLPGRMKMGLARWAAQNGSGTYRSENNGFFTSVKSKFADGLSSVVGEPPVKVVQDTSRKEFNSFLYARRLQGWCEFTPVRQSGMIQISVYAPSGKEAALLANTVAAVYREQKLSLEQGESTHFKEFLQDKLNTVEQNLHYSETALQNFQQRTDAVALDQATSNLVSRISSLQSEYDNITTEIQASESRIASLKSQLNENEKKVVNSASSVSQPYVQSLRDTLSRAQLRLTIMQSNSDIPPNHPQLLQLKKRVSELNDELKKATQKMIAQGLQNIDPIGSSFDMVREILTEQNDLASLKVRETRITNLLNKYNAELEQLPSKQLQLARYQRDLQMNQDLFMLLKRRYEEAKINAAERAGDIQVVDAALVPSAPVKPNPASNLIKALVVGLSLGVGVALIRGFMDTALHSPEDLEKLGLRVLGTVPEIDSSEIKKEIKLQGNGSLSKEPKKIQSKLISHFDQKGPIPEAYRMFNTNLQYLTPDEPLKSILITSAGAGEGKSTTAANLAIATAELGNKTLLLDMDLRRPMVNKIFSIKEVPGLSEVFIKQNTIDDIVHPSSVKNLDVITCGSIPPNPSELITSKRMKEILDNLLERYDRVILDAPPIVLLTDSLILSTLVDKTILVVQAGNTDKKVLNKALQQIKDIGGEVAGALLNRVQQKDLYGSAYYKYYYSSEYGYKKGKHVYS